MTSDTQTYMTSNTQAYITDTQTYMISNTPRQIRH